MSGALDGLAQIIAAIGYLIAIVLAWIAMGVYYGVYCSLHPHADYDDYLPF